MKLIIVIGEVVVFKLVVFLEIEDFYSWLYVLYVFCFDFENEDFRVILMCYFIEDLLEVSIGEVEIVFG